MNTITRWVLIGVAELIFCFWLLGNSADLVSSPSHAKVWLGVAGYTLGLVILPGVSVRHVVTQVHQAKVKQKQLKAAFPNDETSVLQLLDSNQRKRS